MFNNSDSLFFSLRLSVRILILSTGTLKYSNTLKFQVVSFDSCRECNWATWSSILHGATLED